MYLTVNSQWTTLHIAKNNNIASNWTFCGTLSSIALWLLLQFYPFLVLSISSSAVISDTHISIVWLCWTHALVTHMCPCAMYRMYWLEHLIYTCRTKLYRPVGFDKSIVSDITHCYTFAYICIFLFLLLLQQISRFYHELFIDISKFNIFFSLLRK